MAGAPCVRDVSVRQRGTYPRPRDFNLALAVFEVSAVTAVTAVRWFAADAAAQPPLIGMGWHARAFHDPANGHAVPDHHRRINARVVLV